MKLMDKDIEISKMLINWYNDNKRELPWRQTTDPYKIWISEIILQQTRVAQGLDYYIWFINRFPTIELLAEAKEEEVLKYWQGLGYYSRARNLHATAQTIVAQFGGVFPSSYENILSLRGIGEYTAAAIVSFAWNMPYPVVDGNVFRVVEFQHVKPGKGSAFVRTKLKNVISGAVIEKTFNPSEKYPAAQIEKKEMQYLYNDEDLYYFMDNDTYEQIPLNKEQIGDALKFIKENMSVTMLSYKGSVFAVEPPMFVELEVKYTEPGFAGNTTTTSGKPATLENGYELTVPMFVNIGDVIKIDTRTGEYMERV